MTAAADTGSARALDEPRGVSQAEAERLLRTVGPNALPRAGRHGMARMILDVLREPMIFLMVGAVAVYLVVGDVREALVLGASLAVLVAITVVQQRKTERALEALRDLSSPRALVVRDGREQRIAGVDVVPGDLMLLAEGDRVPADARLASAVDLFVDESLLTGESVPVAKRPGTESASVYSGTLIVKGHARAVVSATGSETRLGRIGASLAEVTPEPTALERETARVVRLVAAFAVVLCALLAINVARSGGDIMQGVLAGLTLAMAILPEEFPVVLTVFVALGAWRLSRQQVLTRRLPAIETLGAATVLCVDKTGTLTENRMAVAQVFDGSAWRAPDPSVAQVVEAAALASELQSFDPMDRAVVDAAARAAPRAIEVRKSWKLEKDYAFGEDFLAMCHGWRSPEGEQRICIKGAPETVLPLCGLDTVAAKTLHSELEAAAGRGLRVLAIGDTAWTGEWPADPKACRFAFLGFVALADPLRATVPDAVAQCRRAGIRVLMITGDHAQTATAIAREAGLAKDPVVVEGRALDALDDAALIAIVSRADVFARVLPEQKLRLIGACKRAGEVVAMTGDGVNDAPALKAAHIGVAMGARGTDVAREAASLVLLDDDFGSLVGAVRQGRVIYRNIRHAMSYLLGVHVPIAGLSFLPVLIGWPGVLFPVHVVFLEFVIDPACSVAFEAEQPADDVMALPPRRPDERLFSARLLRRSLVYGFTALASVMMAYGWALSAGLPDGRARGVAFCTLVIANLELIFVSRAGSRPVWEPFSRHNPALRWIVTGTLAALALAIYAPPVAALFRFEALQAQEMGAALAFASAGILWMEPFKAWRAARRRRVRAA
jgi:Ca2+-transporting ATPase